jgi:hypothetical protein
VGRFVLVPTDGLDESGLGLQCVHPWVCRLGVCDCDGLVRRAHFGGVRNFGSGSSINHKLFGYYEGLAAVKDDDGSLDGGRLAGSDVEGSVDSDEESTSDDFVFFSCWD